MLRFAILAALALVSQAAAATTPALLLEAGSARHPLSGHLEVLEDPTGALGIEDVARPGAAFEPTGRGEPNLGISTSVWWIRFEIDSDSQTPEDSDAWLLELAWPLTNLAELHVPGAGHPVQRAGASLGPDEPTLSRRNPTFVLPLNPGELTTAYLRIQSANSQVVPLTVWSRAALAEHEKRELLLVGLLQGILILAVIAGLSFFVLLRDATWFYYAAMVACFGLWDAINAGLPAAFLWPAGWWTSHVLPISGAVGSFALAFFVRRFLSLGDYAPRLDRIPARFLPLLPVLVAWPFVGDIQTFVRFAVALLLFANLWTIWAGISGLAHGQRSARFFLIAWSFLLVAILPSALRGVGLMPTSIWSQHGLQLGIVLTSLTLWLGLGDRLRRTTLDLKELNLSLERRIRDRTAELEATGRELLRANDAKRDFLAAASHDLRQPLHALNLLLGVLDARLREPNLRGLFDQVQQSAQGMGEMLDSLLDLSKLDAGVVEPQVTDFALAPMLEQLAEELREPAGRKGLELRLTTLDAAVRSDPVLLRRIVQNLLTNAIRYTDEGHVGIHCEASSPANPDRTQASRIWIRIVDTGRGIPEAKRRHIFEEYTRLDPEDSTTREGLGLGLSIVQRLSRLLEHPLEVTSNEGVGSSFSVGVERGEARATVPVGRVAPGGFEGARVVVLDDDPAILEGMQQLLESWDCRVVPAVSLESARERLAAEPGAPAALLIDVHLSGEASGIDALDGLRADLGDVPALLVSADSAAATQEVARERGLVILRKPIAPARLRAALKHLLSGSLKHLLSGS